MIGTGKKRRRLNIAAIPNCELWADCALPDTMTFVSGNNVSAVRDLSGKNRHLTKTGAGNETTYPTYVASEKALFFLNDAFDQMITGAAADWNFLHNGSEATIMMMVKIDNAAAADGILLANMTDESNKSGIMFFYHNTQQRYHLTTRNSGGWVFYNSGANNTLAKNQTKILSLITGIRDLSAPNDLIVRSNGATDVMVTRLDTPSAATPPSPLVIGNYPAAGLKARMYLKKIAIFSRRLTKSEENRILDAWACEEGIALTTYPARDLAVIAGQSNAVGFSAFAGTEFATTPQVANARMFNPSGYSWNSPLEAGVNNLGNNQYCIGVEMKLAKEFIAQTGRPLDIVKSAVNGTGMSDWEVADTAFVNLKNAMQKAIWNLEDQGYTVRPFFIWYQGETDAADNTKAAAYENNLKDLINRVTAVPGYNQMPTYVVQISQTPPAIGTATVMQAEMNVPMTIPYSAYTKCVETADIATHYDADHLDGPGYIALGQRLAKRVLKIAE